MRISAQKICVAITVVAVGLLIGACQQEVQIVEAPAAPDHAADLGPATEAFIEAWNAEDLAGFDSLLAADFQRIAADQSVDGPEGMKAFVDQAHTAYVGFHIVVSESAFAENASFMHWTVTGDFSPEDGDAVPVEIHGITLLRFRDGKITHEIVYYDTASLMEQVGATELPHTE